MFARKLSSSPHSRGTVTVGARLAREKGTAVCQLIRVAIIVRMRPRPSAAPTENPIPIQPLCHDSNQPPGVKCE
jgi:hypothetical protein